jgi:hypothetical protein
VIVYVAPRCPSQGSCATLESQITAKVLSITTSPCGVENGGYSVKVGIYDLGTFVGWVSYSHLRDAQLRANQAIAIWDGQVGV